MTQQYIGTKIVTAWKQVMHGKDGYAVTYQDGYTSWSPKDAFDAAYLPIGNISHLPPFAQRLAGELVQMEDKVLRLRSFMNTDAFLALGDAQRLLLTRQLGHMESYASVLRERELLLRLEDSAEGSVAATAADASEVAP
jgi:hypothetical protein